MSHNCDQCKWRRYAERKPKSILGRLWILHTRICPGWKAYLTDLKREGKPLPSLGHDRT